MDRHKSLPEPVLLRAADEEIRKKDEKGAAEDAAFHSLERTIEMVGTAKHKKEDAIGGAGEEKRVKRKKDEDIEQDIAEEFNKYVKFKPYRELSGEELEGIPVDFWPTSPEVRSPMMKVSLEIINVKMSQKSTFNHLMQPADVVIDVPPLPEKEELPMQASAVSQAEVPPQLPTIEPIPQPVTPQPPEPPAPQPEQNLHTHTHTKPRPPRQHKRTPSVPVAPDGSIPNSFLNRNISDWKNAHTSFQIADLSATVKKAKKPVSAPADDGDRKKKSEEYKARLKKLLENMPKEEEKKEEESEGKDKKEPEKDEEPEEEVVVTRMRLPVQRGLARTPTFRKVDVQKVVEIKLPGIVEAVMKYSWFPREQFFHPETDTPEGPGQMKGGPRLKIEPDAETIAPIVLDVFRNASDPKIRLEVAQHLNWMFEEYGFRDSTPIMKCFTRYMQRDASMEMDAYEVQLRALVIESMAKFNANYPETVPTLLLQMKSPHEEIRTKATDFLRALGVRKFDSPYLTEAIDGIYKELPSKPPAEVEKSFAWQTPTVTLSSMTPSSSTSRPTSAAGANELRTLATSFVRQNLQKYLVRTTPDRDVARNLKTLTPFGLEDKERKRESRPGTAEGAKAGSRPGTAGEGRRSRAESVSEHRPMSGLKPVAEQMSASRRPSAVAHHDRRPSAVAHPDRRPSAVGRPDRRPSAAVTKVTEAAPISGKEEGFKKLSKSEKEEKGMEADKEKDKKRVVFQASNPPTPTAELEEGAESKPTQDDILAGAETGGVLVGAERPSSAEAYDSHLSNIVTNRLPAAAIADSFPEDSPFATLEIDRPPLNRNPVTILQNPSSQDFINAINFYILNCERQAAQKERERLEKLRLEAEAAERLRLEKEKQEKYLAYMAQKQAEREAKEEARRRRLEELRKKHEAEGGLPKLKVHDLSSLRTKGIGLTHKSECHPSRETLDVEFRRFPPITAHHGQMSIHIRKFNKSMPVSQSRVQPFSDLFAPAPTTEQPESPLRPTSSYFSSTSTETQAPFSVPSGSSLTKSQQLPTWKEFSTRGSSEWLARELEDVVPRDELEYIRGGDGGSQTGGASEEAFVGMVPAFRTQRKYFIPSLSMATETVAAGQTFGFTD
ncbi:hypothetical protein HDV00_012333 [Rhizophlyctis rosea]|nr:hypothetical protein HDV00_012333 [Rhizophlyctis rosea]